MRKLVLPIVILIIGFFIGLIWWRSGLQAVNMRDKSEKLFVIEPGSGISAISSNLKQEGLIKNPLAFRIMVQTSGLDKKIQAGDFRLSPSMSAEQIAKHLTVGTLDIWVTIPEGKRAEEIAAILEEKMPNYDDTWIEALKQHEGYLFPETYLIPKDAGIDQIITLLTETFNERYKEVNTSQTTFTQDQIVILASLIEREGRHDEDRALISSVLHNRLDIGMALQIDATVQYAIGYNSREKSWWTKGLTYDDLRMQSPYNTYVNPGLPPGPIANPGIESLQAAANPAISDYLYYITDKTGTNRYAKTNAEHEANIERYGL